ncbi:MAG: glycosyltransferase family 2 protein [Rhodopirellula sp.]|nr:glycosyltransferase family 2 protein [Rhodopirellula sp.]
MDLQIVSHCWNYSRMLTYQLSSLVLRPPTELSVTMTVFHNEEDRRTCEVLKFFGAMEIPRVRWNWWNLDQPRLFRRAIGRNLAALENQADWVWFTDCDQIFRGCLDPLARQLQDCEAILVYPREVGCSDYQESDSPILKRLDEGPEVIDINVADFRPVRHEKAIGALQIVRGDVARRMGYCKDIPKFMKPQPRWKRTFEDVAFRKSLGTQGVPIDVPGLFRIEHRRKGRRLWFRATKRL